MRLRIASILCLAGAASILGCQTSNRTSAEAPGSASPERGPGEVSGTITGLAFTSNRVAVVDHQHGVGVTHRHRAD